MAKILDVNNLRISFRTDNGLVQAVRNISFSLEKGKTLAIVGESGSGKSVSAKAILGLLAPNAVVESGSIMYDGKDLLKLSDDEFNQLRGNRVTMVFQDTLAALDPIMKIGKQMTEATILNAKANRKYARKSLKKKFRELDKAFAEKNADKAILTDVNAAVKNNQLSDELMEKFASELSKVIGSEEAAQTVKYVTEETKFLHHYVSKAEAKEQAISIMKDVGIPEPEKRFNQYPFEFSGGMRQRIVIAIAIAANPDILVCDEPTTALDVTIQAQILELIERIQRERQLSVIFITHDLGVVANVADEVAVMYAGKIVEYGTANDIFYNPLHPYTWALLSSMPDLETKEKLMSIPGTPPNMIHPPKGDAFAPRNQYALDIDFEEEPPFFKVSDTHMAATWLLHPDAPKISPPAIVTERIERMTRLNAEKEESHE